MGDHQKNMIGAMKKSLVDLSEKSIITDRTKIYKYMPLLLY